MKTRKLLIAIVSVFTLGASMSALADRDGRGEREWRHEGQRWSQQERGWRHDDDRWNRREHMYRQDYRHDHRYRHMVQERVIVRPAPPPYWSNVYYERPYYPRYEPRIIIDFPTIVLPLH